ncbi:MAG TPA: ABC transporter permease subunit [Candidatus Thermoplasmatota archaeon]|nr:ABC transporter permease subunit [Candidatus Thermoplasmatota archaeon]
MRTRARGWLLLPAVALVTLLLALPLVEVARLAVATEGPVHVEYALARLRASLVVAVLSVVAALAVGLPAAWLLARREFPGRRTLLAVVTVPFVLPGLVAAIAWLAWAGPRGWLGVALPPLALVVLVHAFFNQAVVVRLVGAAWGHQDPRLGDAARALGASPWQVFLRVDVPLAAPAIGAAALLTFLFSFASFAPVLVLGGQDWATTEVGVWLESRRGYWRSAAILALVQLAVTALAAAAYAWLSRRAAARHEPVPGALVRRKFTRHDAPLLGLASALTTLVVLGPLAALGERALRVGDGHGLANFAALASSDAGTFLATTPWEAAGHSATFALAAAAIAVPLGTLAAVSLARRADAWTDAFLALPLGVSAITLGVGFLLLFDTEPFDLRATAVLVVLSHALLAMPLALRSVFAVAVHVPTRLAEAARTLGAGPMRAFASVELPLLAPGIAVAAVFALAVSLGEFAAASVLVRPEHTTLPVLLGRALARPGESRAGQAYALAALLGLLTTALFVAAERLRPRGVS